mmetsp:Transcript_11015/g.37494  ORF Transcript_11015/g.37494 Transcript_11015/m.37494 type:complete len:217 (-) Transcript_11015:255-905(-)
MGTESVSWCTPVRASAPHLTRTRARGSARSGPCGRASTPCAGTPHQVCPWARRAPDELGLGCEGAAAKGHGLGHCQIRTEPRERRGAMREQECIPAARVRRRLGARIWRAADERLGRGLGGNARGRVLEGGRRMVPREEAGPLSRLLVERGLAEPFRSLGLVLGHASAAEVARTATLSTNCQSDRWAARHVTILFSHILECLSHESRCHSCSSRPC